MDLISSMNNLIYDNLFKSTLIPLLPKGNQKIRECILSYGASSVWITDTSTNNRIVRAIFPSSQYVAVYSFNRRRKTYVNFRLESLEVH